MVDGESEAREQRKDNAGPPRCMALVGIDYAANECITDLVFDLDIAHNSARNLVRFVPGVYNPESYLVMKN
jgi:hypothetical protein